MLCFRLSFYIKRKQVSQEVLCTYRAKLYSIRLHPNFSDDASHNGWQSHYAGSLKTASAETWRKNVNNVNVAKRNVNISV